VLRALSRNSGKFSVTLGLCPLFTSAYGQRLWHKYIYIYIQAVTAAFWIEFKLGFIYARQLQKECTMSTSVGLNPTTACC
jgi:hypothetical protein